MFKGDKFVGELTGLETIFHLMVINKFNSCTISVPNIFKDEDSNTDLMLLKKKNSKINVDFVDGIPHISVQIYLQGYGLSLGPDTDYSSKEELEKINTSAEKFLETEITNYLYKTSKEFNSDIDGFGKKAVLKYLTIGDWNTSNWLENYKNSVFDVKVTVNIKTGYKLNKTP